MDLPVTEQPLLPAALDSLLDREVERIGAFFRSFDEGKWFASIHLLSGVFLIDLYVVHRFGKWEALGMRDHLDAGFPNYPTALRRLSAETLAAVRENRSPRSLFAETIYRGVAARFNWPAVPVAPGYVLLSIESEDILLDRLAKFLFGARHSNTGFQGKGPCQEH